MLAGQVADFFLEPLLEQIMLLLHLLHPLLFLLLVSNQDLYPLL